ncbi:MULTISPECIES: GlcG/HbpS family heme-binding protein [Marinobacter]|uniref:GlcG/HbpS family heme-binding protein n=1 Tax=Marinobacter TaxID=2742 RepID=UPI0012471F35|nr:MULTISPECIES: heme-binding protein [Marinobacter]MBL3556348.1 heme-binding protein [Marinobacter sp. JB05H06]
MVTRPEHAILEKDFSLTDYAVMRLMSAAMDKAKELGFKASVSVVDRSGTMLGFVKMSSSFIVSTDLSARKARCAAGMGVETIKLEEMLSQEQPRVREGLLANDSFTLIGGGIPLVWENRVVGGIGVSGGSEAQDIECAQAAVRSLL